MVVNPRKFSKVRDLKQSWLTFHFWLFKWSIPAKSDTWKVFNFGFSLPKEFLSFLVSFFSVDSLIVLDWEGHFHLFEMCTSRRLKALFQSQKKKKFKWTALCTPYNQHAYSPYWSLYITKVLIRRICSTIKPFFTWWSFPLFSWPSCLIQRWYCKEKLDANHS